MKKLLLIGLTCLFLLSGCGPTKTYPAKLSIAKESTQYPYTVNNDPKQKYTLVIPTISHQDKTYSLVYSLNPIVENKNDLGLTGATLYKEDDIDLSFKNTIYNYALYGYGYWILNESGLSKNEQSLTAEDYSVLQGDLYHTSSVDNTAYIRYYLATQELIWESILDPKTQTPYNIEFEGLDLTVEKQAILANAINTQKTPFFNGTVYHITPSDIESKTQINLQDQNGVLSQFSLNPTSNITVVSSENNTLSFIVNELQEINKIEFVPRFKTQESVSQIFSSDENISYLVIGSDAYLRNTSSLLIEPQITTSTLKFIISTYDSDTKKPLYGAQYEISSTADFKNPVKTTLSEEGKPAMVTDLTPGTYYVQQIVAPEGYELNSVVATYTIEEDIKEKDVPFLNKAK